MKEARLCFLNEYSGHVDRFVGTAKEYDYSTIGGAIGGATHVVTSGAGLDPLIRDGLSLADKKDGNSRLSAYNGLFGFYGKTTENTVGTVGNLLRGKIGSAIGGLINLAGDGISDTVDFATGHRHNSSNFSQAA